MLRRFLAQHLRKERQNVSAFKALRAANGSLTTGVRLPAGATLHVSTTAALGASTGLVRAKASRTLGAPAGSANAKHRIGYFEQDVVIDLAPSAVGTVSLYVEDAAGKLFKIAGT